MMSSLLKLLLILFQISLAVSQEEECIRPMPVPPDKNIRISQIELPPYNNQLDNCYMNVTTDKNHFLKMICREQSAEHAEHEDAVEHADTVDEEITEPCDKLLTVIKNGSISGGNSVCLPLTVYARRIILRNKLSTMNGTVLFSCKIKSYEDCKCGRIADLQPEVSYERSFRSSPSCYIDAVQGNKILGGEMAEDNEFPSLSGIFLQEYTDVWTHNCSGVIISPRIVLTVAHCVRKPVNLYRVSVGPYHPKIPECTIYHNIIEKIKNEHHDIALLKTETEITFSKDIGPACLPFDIVKEELIGSTITAAGWGEVEEYTGKTPITLMKVDLEVVSDDGCVKFYKAYHKKQNLCVFTPKKDTCRGDSGGPLYYRKNNHYFVVGLIARGKKCGEIPSVNMNVKYFIKWIKSELPDERFCVMPST
ncbi:hypothetical protein O3M35_011661 [Rhynocoris fuscipes]|uniref:Peptidase S1 domain-containing protein n=1 Tax=Rhynocoris fuscipes TaxID=488301 RepID=A0AAW1D3R9_9HEMI